LVVVAGQSEGEPVVAAACVTEKETHRIDVKAKDDKVVDFIPIKIGGR
jgi:hypothetical protein